MNAFGDEGAEAVRSFTVNTSPPAAPAITGRPPFPTNNPSPSFSWAMEAGASARWQVLGSGGNVIQTSDTPASSATVSPLPNGAYVFRVVAIDPAGNASAPTSDPFSIAGSPPAAKVASLTSLLPHAERRAPEAPGGHDAPHAHAGAAVDKGPKGTTLYNLQLFRVVREAGELPPVVTKVSRLPRGHRSSASPASMTLPGTCYVWRDLALHGQELHQVAPGHQQLLHREQVARAKAAKAPRRRPPSRTRTPVGGGASG